MREKNNTGLITFTNNSILMMLLIIIVLGTIFGFMRHSIKHQFENDIANQLSTVMKTTNDTYDLWINTKFSEMSILLHQQGVLRSLRQLLAAKENNEDIIGMPALQHLRATFEPWLLKEDGLGFFLFTPDGKSVASMRDSNIGIITPLAIQTNNFKQVFSGESILVKPIPSEVELPGVGDVMATDVPTMFFVVPVYDENNRIIAAFSVRYAPEKTFSQIAGNARSGKTGDFYLINEQGAAITSVRFAELIRKSGLLADDKNEILYIRIADPGVDLTRDEIPETTALEMPLTKMAESAINGNYGLDLDGYTNYKGVPVVGTWNWDKEFNFGLAYEIDKSEAFASYNIVQNIVLLSFAMLVVVFIAIFIMLNLKNREMLATSKLIKESKDKFQTVTDSVTDAIVMINSDDQIMFWSHSAYKMFGYRYNEVMGKHLHSLIVPERFRPLAKRGWGQFQQTGTGHIIGTLREIVATGRDGNEFPVELSINSVQINNEWWAVGVIRDITVRVEKEKELQMLSERLKLATSAARIGIWDYDVAKGDLYWDDTMFELYDIPKEKFGRDIDAWNKRVHPDDLDSTVSYMEDALRGDSEFDTTFRILRGEDIHYIKANAIVSFDENSQPVRMIGTNFDITERMEAQEALKEINNVLEEIIRERTNDLEQSKKAAISIMQDANISRQNAESALAELKRSQVELEKLSKAINASPVSVVITDADSVIEYVNPKYCETTGYSFDETIGQKTHVLKSGQMEESFYADLWKTIAQGKDWVGEFINRKKDGSFFWERAYLSPIADESGRIVNYVAVKEDITDEKKAQKALSDALTRAEDATRAKSDFLANMSHEIRTPMNAVIGLSHLALSTDSKTKQRDYITKISMSAKSLLNIINDILDFSKIEAGRLHLEEISFSFSGLMDEIVSVFKSQFSAKGLEFGLSLPADIPGTLVGDPVRLTQVINNLLSNAMKFTETGSVDLHAEIVGIDEKEETLRLSCSVSDTGIGMSADQVKDIFNKFSQADTSTTRKYGGTGLGLAICKQILELMDGDIRVESEPGKGSRFVFDVKLGYRNEHIERKDMMIHLSIRGLKTLLIDGDEKTRGYLRKQLELLSFAVAEQTDCVKGRDALRHSIDESEPFELIILDFELLKAEENNGDKNNIRDDERYYEFPMVVLCSVSNTELAAEMFKKHEMTVIVEKPATTSDIYNAVLDVMGYTATVSSPENKRFSGSMGRILLAEDNDINLEIAQEYLNAEDFDFDVARNGLEALEMVKKYRYSLVLMDIQMPEMDGITATEKIREWEEQMLIENPAYQKLPVIAMTAHAMTGDREKGIEAGMSDYITKPIEPDIFYQVLGKWLTETEPDDASSAEKRDEEGDSLENLEGIDTSSGLARMLGNVSKYKELLLKFAENHSEDISRINSALEEGSKETALGIVHSLKGLAGSLGAENLRELAAQLESSMKNDTGEVAERISITGEVLDRIVETIKTNVRKDEAEKADTVAIPREELLETMVSLGRLLDENDLEAVNSFQEIRASIAEYTGRDKLDRLDEFISNYRFDDAAELLKEMRIEVQGG